MTKRSNRIRGGWKLMWTALCLLVIGAASTLSAQYTYAVEVQVKNDMAREWEELQKQFNAAAEKKGELQSRHIWQQVFGNTSTYLILTPLSKYADLDDSAVGANAMGEAEFARWVARVTKCIQNRQVRTSRPRPDLSIPPPEGWKPNLAHVRVSEVEGGQGAAYSDLIENMVAAGYKKAGVAPFYVAQGELGGATRRWVTVTYADKFADLDDTGRLRRALGEEKWSELVGKIGSVVKHSERWVIRYRDELSFGGF